MSIEVSQNKKKAAVAVATAAAAQHDFYLFSLSRCFVCVLCTSKYSQLHTITLWSRIQAVNLIRAVNRFIAILMFIICHVFVLCVLL